MKTYEFTGKTIEKAINEGLKQLNKNREDVDIAILSEGGLFSKAKVRISFDDETVEDITKEILNEENLALKTKVEEKNICENSFSNDCKCKNEPLNEKPCEEKCCCENCDCDDECDCDRNEEDTKKQVKEKQLMSSEEVYDKIQEIFSNIFKYLNIDAKVMILENDEAYEVKIMGDEKVSNLIGFRGEGLNAYQFLINNFKDLRNKPKRILIDVENYRNKREESLKNLANRIAKKVLKTKKRHKFEPMSAFERHIIHEELANFSGVTTHSEGVEPHRCLIVDIEK